MRFLVIDPQKREVRSVEAEGFDALRGTELGKVGLDFSSTPIRGLTLAIYEYSLVKPLPGAEYWSWNGHLFCGTAILYWVDEGGETVSVPPELDENVRPTWLMTADPNEVERKIERGEVRRPFTAVNGVRVWEWRPKAG